MATLRALRDTPIQRLSNEDVVPGQDVGNKDPTTSLISVQSALAWEHLCNQCATRTLMDSWKPRTGCQLVRTLRRWRGAGRRRRSAGVVEFHRRRREELRRGACRRRRRWLRLERW